MKLYDIVGKLDEDFLFSNEMEDLANWSFTKDSKKYLNEDFLEKQTGLMIKGSENISEVFTCVFVTDEIINQIKFKPNCLLVTHHNFDYYEDGRGLCPISEENLLQLVENNVSLYVAHAGLDTHEIYGTSKCLADLLDIEIEEYFFDYFGKPTAIIGKVKNNNFAELVNLAKEKINKDYLTIKINSSSVSRIAVIAGGGDEPDILRKSFELGADTLIGGTIKNNWKVPIVQELNKEFHELNEELKLNLIGGSHYGTERPAMIKLVEYFEKLDMKSYFIEDENLLIDIQLKK